MYTSYYGTPPRSDELYHFGIKGMKWGVRRYENKDGTLTEAGKKRYGTKENYERSRTRKKRILKGAAAAAAAAALGYGIYRNRAKNKGSIRLNDLDLVKQKTQSFDDSNYGKTDSLKRRLMGELPSQRTIKFSERKTKTPTPQKVYLLEDSHYGKTGSLKRKYAGESPAQRTIKFSERKTKTPASQKTYLLEEYARSRGAVGPLKRSTDRLKGSKNMYNFSTYAMTEPLNRSSVNNFWITDRVRNKRNLYNFTGSGKKENERKAANKFASRKLGRTPYMDDIKIMLEYAKGHRGKNDPDVKDIIKGHYSDKPYLEWLDRIDKKYKSDLRKRFNGE